MVLVLVLVLFFWYAGMLVCCLLVYWHAGMSVSWFVGLFLSLSL